MMECVQCDLDLQKKQEGGMKDYSKANVEVPSPVHELAALMCLFATQNILHYINTVLTELRRAQRLLRIHSFYCKPSCGCHWECVL